jgi:hypothetical protein
MLRPSVIPPLSARGLSGWHHGGLNAPRWFTHQTIPDAITAGQADTFKVYAFLPARRGTVTGLLGTSRLARCLLLALVRLDDGLVHFCEPLVMLMDHWVKRSGGVGSHRHLCRRLRAAAGDPGAVEDRVPRRDGCDPAASHPVENRGERRCASGVCAVICHRSVQCSVYDDRRRAGTGPG